MPEDKILAIALLSQAKDHTIRAIAECLSHTCNSTREWKEDFVHEKAYETIRDAVLDLAAIAARCAVQEGWRSIPEHLHTLSEEMLTELELDDEENGQEGCSERLYEEVVNEFKLRLP